MAIFQRLAQLRPATTYPAVAFYITAGMQRATVDSIFICNTSGSASSFRIFLSGTPLTYNETTALFWDMPVDPGETVVVELNIYVDNVEQRLVVRSANANALTFTLFGSIGESV